MVSCDQLIQSFLDYSEEHFECELKGSYYVLTTPFAYYDGDLVQIFIREIADGEIEISDLGHAVRKLNAAGINVNRARSRKNKIDAIIRSRSVDFDRGRLYTYCETNEFADSLIRLVQAMLQTDDLIFSRATPLVRSFTGEIEGHLQSLGIEYRKTVRLQGIRSHEFDFQLELPMLTVIKGLSAVSNFGADDQANRLAGAILDLKQRYTGIRPFVLLDDTTEVSWHYAEGILRSLTDDIYKFDADAKRLNDRLSFLKQTAA